MFTVQRKGEEEIDTRVLKRLLCERSFNDRYTKSIIRANDVVYMLYHSFPRDTQVIGIMKKLDAREVIFGRKEKDFGRTLSLGRPGAA